MLNRQLVADHAQIVRGSITRLRGLGDLSWEQFKSDPDNYAIAEHHLRRALQALLDLGRHLVVKLGWGNPANYREVLTELGRQGVLEEAFLARIRGIAGYRNRLVHEYAEVSQDEMWSILQHQLDDLVELLNKLLAYAAGLES